MSSTVADKPTLGSSLDTVVDTRWDNATDLSPVVASSAGVDGHGEFDKVQEWLINFTFGNTTMDGTNVTCDNCTDGQQQRQMVSTLILLFPFSFYITGVSYFTIVFHCFSGFFSTFPAACIIPFLTKSNLSILMKSGRQKHI